MEEKKAAVQVEDTRFLFVTVNDVEYGIDIDMVQEIIVMQEVSPIPSTKPFCKGVINIRGTIVPVIDLRIKMGLEACVYNEDACIVVVMIGGERIGMIVEAVRDVLQIKPTQLQKSPAKDEALGKCNISSQIANIDGAVKQILDMKKVFDLDQDVQQAAE